MGRKPNDTVEIDKLIEEYVKLPDREVVPLRKFVTDKITDVKRRSTMYQRMYLRLRKEHGYRKPETHGTYTSIGLSKESHNKLSVLKHLTGSSLADLAQQAIDEAFRSFTHKEKDSLYASYGGAGALGRHDIPKIGEEFLSQKKIESISEFLKVKGYDGYGSNLKKLMGYVAKRRGVKA